MTKILITIVIVGALAFGGWELYLQWNEAKGKPDKVEVVAPVDPATLPGMPAGMEAAYNIAKGQGAVGLKNFLTRYGKAIQDPRLASIELDYVVLVSKDNIAEARLTFARVKDRTPPSSPVYSRMKQLEKTYE
jgi:hypothetical protein